MPGLYESHGTRSLSRCSSPNWPMKASVGRNWLIVSSAFKGKKPNSGLTIEGIQNGDQKSRLATLRQRAVRLVYRHRAHRSTLSGAPSGASSRCQRDLRAGCADVMAHSPAGADLDRHGWLRPRPAMGRPDRGDPARRCGLVLARREALAWGFAYHGDDAHRHSGKPRREGRGLDGEG